MSLERRNQLQEKVSTADTGNDSPAERLYSGVHQDWEKMHTSLQAVSRTPESSQLEISSIFANEKSAKPQVADRPQSKDVSGGKLSYDSQGRLDKITYADGTSREFRWDGQNLIATKTREGQWFDRRKSADGKLEDAWAVRGKDGTWPGRIDLDAKTGAYTLTSLSGAEANVRWTESVGGKEETNYPDGRKKLDYPGKGSISFDANGLPERLVGEDGYQREFKWSGTGKDAELVGVKVTATDKSVYNWEKRQDGWYCNGEAGGKDLSFDKQTNMYAWRDTKTGEVNALNAEGRGLKATADGSHVESLHGKVLRAKQGDHTFSYEYDGDKLKKAVETDRSGKTIKSWEQSKDGNWKSSEGEQFKGTLAADALGRPYAKEIQYPDGRKREFTKDEQGNLSAVTDTGADGSKQQWERSGDNEWKSGSTKWKGSLELNGLKYEAYDLGTKTHTIYSPDGSLSQEFKAENRLVEWKDNKVSSVKIGDTERKYERKNGKITEIDAVGSGIKLVRQSDDTWKRFDASGKEAPDGYVRRGDASVDAEGNCSFLTDKGTVLKQDIKGKTTEISDSSALGKAVLHSTALSDEAKMRFVENLHKFEQRSDISDSQKKATVKHIERLYNYKGNDEFSNADCQKLADQLTWHVANPDKDGQGTHPTCNVSDIRISMEHETPSDFAKMAADVITTGKYVTAFGQTITPRAGSFRPGKEEREFPPRDGYRSWIGQISDVTMANIHWQRQTTDSKGTAVTAGLVQFEQVRPTGHDDDGTRLYRYEHRTDGWFRTELAREPELSAAAINDIYRQITGKQEDGRVLVHSSRTSGQGAIAVSSPQELAEQLAKGPKTKIIELENDKLYKRAPDGEDHEHVVVAVRYSNGRIAIDNSHEKAEDLLAPGKEISVEDLYAAMSAPPVPSNAAKKPPVIEKWDEKAQRWSRYEAPQPQPVQQPVQQNLGGQQYQQYYWNGQGWVQQQPYQQQPYQWNGQQYQQQQYFWNGRGWQQQNYGPLQQPYYWNGQQYQQQYWNGQPYFRQRSGSGVFR